MNEIPYDDVIAVYHMGDGYIVLSQFGEDVGHQERVSCDSAKLIDLCTPFTSVAEAEVQASRLMRHAANLRIAEARKTRIAPAYLV